MSTLERKYYAILGLRRDATKPQIKAAYKRLIWDRHPDRGGDPAAFVELTTAYNVLSDPLLRKQYDLAGELPDWDSALQLQDSVIKSIASTLERALADLVKDGVSIDSIDFMKGFQTLCKMALEKFVEQEEEAKDMLAALHKLHKRVKRRDGGDNAIAKILEAKILEKQPELTILSRSVQVGKRVLEELALYKDKGLTFDDFLRSQVAGRHPMARDDEEEIFMLMKS